MLQKTFINISNTPLAMCILLQTCWYMCNDCTIKNVYSANDKKTSKFHLYEFIVFGSMKRTKQT